MERYLIKSTNGSLSIFDRTQLNQFGEWLCIEAMAYPNTEDGWEQARRQVKELNSASN
jgi:hypothetical protein